MDKITEIKANKVLKCSETTIVEPRVKQLECFISPFQELGRHGLCSPGEEGMVRSELLRQEGLLNYLQMSFPI